MCIHDHQEDETQTQEIRDMHRRRTLIQGLAAGGVLTVASSSLSGCTTNPETGAKQFVAFAPGDAALSQAAAQSWNEIKAKTPQSNDPRYTTRLKNVGKRVSKGANKHTEKWDYRVIAEDTKNAFVLPGNRVAFYTGMMDFTDNDDQVAAIMGHEVGHVTGRHARERMSIQTAGALGQGAVAIAGASVLGDKCKKTSRTQVEYNQCMSGAQQKTQLLQQAMGLGFMVGISLPYSRRHESESDLLGAKYMYKAGYDPYQAVKLWEKMAADSESRQPEFMSTHPDPARRARDLHEYIKYQEQLGSQGWQSIQMPG